MSSEMIDVYNENMEFVGTVTKRDAHKKGLWHVSIHCWIVRSEEPGYLLFQKRGADKDLFPNALDISAAGHYRAGEKIEDGVREIMEELGLKVDFESLIPLGIKIDLGLGQDIVNREFCRVFMLLENRLPNEYQIDPSEVEGLVQISIPEGLRLFAGQVDKVPAQGVEYLKDTHSWHQIDISVDRDMFIPRLDPYYYKMFILADRALREERHLAI